MPARTKIEFPLLKDPGNAVADQFGAQRTPEVFLLDGQRRVRYWGRIDDQYGVGYARPQALRKDLAAALDELLAGKDDQRAGDSRRSGCFIGRVKRTPPAGEVTYTRDIAPLVQQHCVGLPSRGAGGPLRADQLRRRRRPGPRRSAK